MQWRNWHKLCTATAICEKKHDARVTLDASALNARQSLASPPDASSAKRTFASSVCSRIHIYSVLFWYNGHPQSARFVCLYCVELKNTKNVPRAASHPRRFPASSRTISRQFEDRACAPETRRVSRRKHKRHRPGRGKTHLAGRNPQGSIMYNLQRDFTFASKKLASLSHSRRIGDFILQCEPIPEPHWTWRRQEWCTPRLRKAQQQTLPV